MLCCCYFIFFLGGGGVCLIEIEIVEISQKVPSKRGNAA